MYMIVSLKSFVKVISTKDIW